MRIKLKTLSFTTLLLALAALLSGNAHAQDVLQPTPVTANRQTEAASDGGAPVPPRPERVTLPTLQALSGPIVVWSNAMTDGTKYVGLASGTPISSGYGQVSSGPIHKARIFFSNSVRAKDDLLILRVGTTQGLQFPLAVKTLGMDGFELYVLDPKVTVRNALTGEVYDLNHRVIPFLFSGLNFSNFIDVDFGEDLNFVQVLIEKTDNRSDVAVNFIWVNAPPQERPAPPGHDR